jgi:PREDICTED: predicted protein-like
MVITFNTKGSITCAAIYEVYILTGSVDMKIRKWSIETTDCLYIYEGHKGKINRLIVGGRFFFTTSYDKLAKVWYLDALSNYSDESDDDDNFNMCLRTFQVTILHN